MVVTNFVDASNYPHIPFEFSMFSRCSFCMSCSLTSKKLNASLATWCAPRRSCSRNIAVRNVFRALIREQHLLFLLLFQICYVFPHILRPCPPEHIVRNVWRASWIPSVPPLGAALEPPGPPSPARNSGQPRPIWILAAQGRHGTSRTTFSDLTASIFRPPK